MPNYSRFGLNTENEDVTDLLAKTSKGAMSMFITLKRGRDGNTNLSILPPALNPTLGNSESRKLRELEKVGLIRKVTGGKLIEPDGSMIKVGRRTYIINPMVLIPRMNEDFDKVLGFWAQCCKK